MDIQWFIVCIGGTSQKTVTSYKWRAGGRSLYSPRPIFAGFYDTRYLSHLSLITTHAMKGHECALTGSQEDGIKHLHVIVNVRVHWGHEVRITYVT